MITNWTVPFELFVTGVGTLPINQPFSTADDRRFQLHPDKCTMVLPVRSTEDDIPQADGKIPHRRWRSGFGAHLALELLQAWNDGNEPEVACGAVLQEMTDTLGLYLNAMIRTGLVQGELNARLIWTPDGFANRMIDRGQLSIAPAADTQGALGGTSVEFDIDTPYPYYMEEAETDTTFLDGDEDLIENAGNTDFFPVIKVYGPYTGFTLTNHTVIDLDGNPAQLIYDDALPPSTGTWDVADGDYIEFNFFRGSGYLNGNGPSRLGGIRWDESDFFPLVPGDNLIEFTSIGGDAGTSGTQVLVLSNGAFA